MKTLKPTLTALLMAMTVAAATAWGYGGGGGGAASCPEAKFYEESPARNSVLAQLSEIAVAASDNTDIATLEMNVNGKPAKPSASQRRSGEWDLQLKLPEAITQPGKVLITLAAKSKEGCASFFPYTVQIQP